MKMLFEFSGKPIDYIGGCKYCEYNLIDTFVNAVFVYDDKLVLIYNYQQGTQTIMLKEV